MDGGLRRWEGFFEEVLLKSLRSVASVDLEFHIRLWALMSPAMITLLPSPRMSGHRARWAGLPIVNPLRLVSWL